MANLPDDLEVALLDYVARATTPAALTGPMRVQLLSALGSGDAPGTVVAGAIQNLGASAPTSGAGTTSNAAILRWEGLANPTTVAGYQIMDSAATPRITVTNIGRTGGSVSVTDGVFEVAAGGLVVTAA